MTDWISETLYPDWEQRFRNARVLAEERSPFQHIVVADTPSHGRILVLDGCIQVTQADEFFYQEMIAHVPLIAHGSAKRVLIIGAGDGGVLRRVLQHRGVESVVMVEIDGAVVRLCKTFLPGIGGDSWSDPRAEVIIGDGIGYLANAEAGSFDVVIVDSTDPAGVGEALFTEQFYSDCARALSEGGIVVNQCGVPFMQPEELRETSQRRARSFPCISAYLVAVPTYVGGAMALGYAAKDQSGLGLTIETVRTRAEAAGISGTTRYWSPEVHLAAFALPPYVRELLPD